MPINSFLYPGPSNSNPYVVDNSCMFNDGDSAFLSKTFSGDGTSHDIGTVSFWLKRGELGAEQGIFTAGASTRNFIRIESNDTLTFRSVGDSFHLQTTQVFRDPSSWYSIIIAWDTSQGTASDRVNFYVNGSQVTAFGTATYPAQNLDIKLGAAELNCIGKDSEQTTPYFDGYLSEFVYIDGQQLTPTSFGEFDADSPTIFKPKNLDPISGIKGTNGFYLDFEDSADLGNDVWGGNDFAETNLAATDQASDSPTNNFCTLNPLDRSTLSSDGTTFAEGNLKTTDASSNYLVATGSMAVTSGKWYFECKIDATASHTASGVLIVDLDGWDRTDGAANGSYGWLYAANGDKRNGGSSSSYGDGFSANDIIGVAIDMDNTSVYFSRNGTFQASGDPTSGASKTNAAFTNLTGTITAQVYDGSSGQAHEFSLNFGNPPYANSSDAADENGYGAFEYAPPSGFLALCTQNLGSDGG